MSIDVRALSKHTFMRNTACKFWEIEHALFVSRWLGACKTPHILASLLILLESHSLSCHLPSNLQPNRRSLVCMLPGLVMVTSAWQIFSSRAGLVCWHIWQVVSWTRLETDNSVNSPNCHSFSGSSGVVLLVRDVQNKKRP